MRQLLSLLPAFSATWLAVPLGWCACLLCLAFNVVQGRQTGTGASPEVTQALTVQYLDLGDYLRLPDRKRQLVVDDRDSLQTLLAGERPKRCADFKPPEIDFDKLTLLGVRLDNDCLKEFKPQVIRDEASKEYRVIGKYSMICHAMRWDDRWLVVLKLPRDFKVTVIINGKKLETEGRKESSDEPKIEMSRSPGHWLHISDRCFLVNCLHGWPGKAPQRVEEPFTVTYRVKVVSDVKEVDTSERTNTYTEGFTLFLEEKQSPTPFDKQEGGFLAGKKIETLNVKSDNANVVTAEQQGNKITLIGSSFGTAEVTVTGKTVSKVGSKPALEEHFVYVFRLRSSQNHQIRMLTQLEQPRD